MPVIGKTTCCKPYRAAGMGSGPQARTFETRTDQKAGARFASKKPLGGKVQRDFQSYGESLERCGSLRSARGRRE